MHPQAAPLPEHSAGDGIGSAFARGTRDVRALFLTVLFGLPLALVFVPGILRTVGIAYGIVYLAFLTPVTGVYAWLLLDAALLLSKKSPLWLPKVFALSERLPLPGSPPPRRAIRHIERYVEFAGMIHPLSGLVRAMLWLTFRVRPEFARGVIRDARIERAKSPPSQPGATYEPQLQAARPLVRDFKDTGDFAIR
jgi:hypothetical protein